MSASVSLPQSAAEFFGRYSTVALMANSEGLDADAVRASLPPETLFVFFTRCPRILSRPFDGDAVLCHRMKDANCPNEGEKHVRRARSLFVEGSLKAEIGLLASYVGSIRPAHPDRSETVGYLLDLDDLFGGWYTEGKTPTTGFALAIWLARSLPETTAIHLCGFTGVRGADFRMRTMHDWTLEQAVLRILYRRGRLTQFGRADESNVGAAVRGFLPDVSDGEIALVAADVVNDRLNALDVLVAKLWSLASIPRAVTDLTARLRWKRLRGRRGPGA